MKEKTNKKEVKVTPEEGEYEAHIFVGAMESTYGIREPVKAHFIYTWVMLLMTIGLVYNIWIHNIVGILLFFLLRAIWRMKAKKNLGIPEARVMMVGKTDG